MAALWQEEAPTAFTSQENLQLSPTWRGPTPSPVKAKCALTVLLCDAGNTHQILTEGLWMPFSGVTSTKCCRTEGAKASRTVPHAAASLNPLDQLHQS